MTQSVNTNENEFEQEIESIKAVYPEVTINIIPFSIICIINFENTYSIETTFTKPNEDIIISVQNNKKAVQQHSKNFLHKLESKLNHIYKNKKDSMPVFECISYLNDSLNNDIRQMLDQQPKKSVPKKKTHDNIEQKKQNNADKLNKKRKNKNAKQSDNQTNISNNRFRYKHNEMVKNNENKTDSDGYDYYYAYNYKHYVKDAIVTDKYVLFYKDIFSQWFPSKFIIDNITYVNCEQYMMAQKAKLFNDKNSLKLILSETDPSKIIKLGRRVTGFKEKTWIKHRENIVYEGNFNKFTQNEILKKKLMSYDKSLYFVEASGPDKIWGIGLAINNPSAQNKRNWKGLNLLGKAITKVRNDILEHL